jgi:hypothetical protein
VAILSTTKEANELGMVRENRCGDTRPFTVCQMPNRVRSLYLVMLSLYLVKWSLYLSMP